MEAPKHRPAAYVVAFDLLSRVLLTQFHKEGHPRSGAWTLPGGGMEWGEQAFETAQRELMEETGLDGQIGPLLGVQSQWFGPDTSGADHRSHALRLVFGATDCKGALKREFEDDDTTIGAAWFTLEEVANLDRVDVVDFGIALALAKRE